MTDTAPDNAALLDELRWRGLLHQTTDERALAQHLRTPRRVYAGFDPTADSLTIGNLVPIMLLKHFQRRGHTPVVVMGGGTGLIGDPSGKEQERPLLDESTIRSNIASQRRIFDRLLAGEPAPLIVDNADWLLELGYIQTLRDIGKHFSVNEMIRRDAVARRLESREQGVSYTEFSYMILQAYDFLHLYRKHGVTVQAGGSDQWGNIASGVDLIRRLEQAEAHGLTCPLVVKADGGKFGKTESGAVWLTAERTSPYAYHQFWINAADADVEAHLKRFTLLDREQIEQIMAEHSRDPGARVAQRALAREATTLLHGQAACRRAEAIAEALFKGDVRSLDAEALRDAFAEAPSSEHDAALLEGEGVSLVELLPLTSLASSRRQAKQLLAEGAVSVNSERVDPTRRLTSADLLHNEAILLRRGRKHWHITRWKPLDR